MWAALNVKSVVMFKIHAERRRTNFFNFNADLNWIFIKTFNINIETAVTVTGITITANA